jgi:hypothetical protein
MDAHFLSRNLANKRGLQISQSTDGRASLQLDIQKRKAVAKIVKTLET